MFVFKKILLADKLVFSSHFQTLRDVHYCLRFFLPGKKDASESITFHSVHPAALIKEHKNKMQEILCQRQQAKQQAIQPQTCSEPSMGKDSSMKLNPDNTKGQSKPEGELAGKMVTEKMPVLGKGFYPGQDIDITWENSPPPLKTKMTAAEVAKVCVEKY